MKKKRKETEAYILKYIDELIIGGSEVTDLYRNLFKSMNDKEFDIFMQNLRSGKTTLSVIIPNGGKLNIDMNNNFKIAKKLGFSFFEKVKITGDKEIGDYVTPIEFLVLKLPVRRAAQLLMKKISIPEDTKSIDVGSGQVTGKSRGARMTLPEIQILTGLGMDKSISEILTVRGGDMGAGNAEEQLLYKQGSATLEQIEQYKTGVVSKKTLNAYFNAMMFKTTL